MDTFFEILLLFILGLCGWGIFEIVHFPVPALLGSMLFIAGLRIAQLPIPTGPSFLYPIVQILLGYFIGTRMKRELFQDFKKLIQPGLLIIVWVFSLLFGFGILFSHLYEIDFNTAILSSSVGGLAEISIIAHDIDADITIIICAQLMRLILTNIAFPILLKNQIRKTIITKGKQTSVFNKLNIKKFNFKALLERAKVNLCRFVGIRSSCVKSSCLKVRAILVDLAVPIAGGLLFWSLGIPAGAMVGALIFVIGIVALGRIMTPPPPIAFKLLQVFIGIEISNNISHDSLSALISQGIFTPLLLLTCGIFISSLLIAYLIKKITKWDYVTCFLASAPAGFTAMTVLAIDSDRNPFSVSTLHLFRILTIKIFVPILFYFM